MTTTRLLLACMLAALLTLSGCGDDSVSAPPPEPDPLPADTPPNDTPAHTLTRFETAYENQVLAEYVALLSADFRYEFSPESDPMLVAQFDTTWGVSRDSASTAHLFEGFTNDIGYFMPGAAGITMSLAGVQIVGDPDHQDSTAYYKYAIVPVLSLSLDVSGTYGYEIAAPHDFQLVRGDAAALRAAQPADSTHWYIRRQVDKSPALAARATGSMAPARALPAEASSLGLVKAQYLQ